MKWDETRNDGLFIGFAFCNIFMHIQDDNNDDDGDGDAFRTLNTLICSVWLLFDVENLYLEWLLVLGPH